MVRGEGRQVVQEGDFSLLLFCQQLAIQMPVLNNHNYYIRVKEKEKTAVDRPPSLTSKIGMQWWLSSCTAMVGFFWPRLALTIDCITTKDKVGNAIRTRRGVA